MFRSQGQADRIESSAEGLRIEIHTHIHIGFELDPLDLHLFKATVNHPFFHLEVGDTVTEKTPDAISFLKHRHDMTGTGQLLGSREARGSGPHDSHGFPRRRNREDGLHPSLMKPFINDVPFNDPNGDRIAVDAEHTSRLARSWTETARKLREIIRRV